MIKKLSLVIFLFLESCSATGSQKAMNALNSGNKCEFCRISAETIKTDTSSINNLGDCYDNGYCNYPKDTGKAIELFTLAAKWGVPKAVENLQIHGIKPPIPIYKIAQNAKNVIREEQQKAELEEAFKQVLIGTTAIFNAKSRALGDNSYQSFKPQNEDAQGCCSYHNGIFRDYNNQSLCHESGMILCNDLNPSPSCSCP